MRPLIAFLLLAFGFGVRAGVQLVGIDDRAVETGAERQSK